MAASDRQLIAKLLSNKQSLKHHICRRLNNRDPYDDLVRLTTSGKILESAVLLPLLYSDSLPSNPYLLLNKRSEKVRQPGDLCFPGGGTSPLDAILAKFQKLPIGHLKKWPEWKNRQTKKGAWEMPLARLLTTSLREAYEEMRLNPFGVSFLGPLPAQQLVMFKRTIYPMVGWLTHQKRFKPNWEVDRIVSIPLENFFDRSLYGRYRLSWKQDGRHPSSGGDFPCFKVIDNAHHDILWGATFRITMSFLEICFDFKPPPFEDLPIFSNHLENNYFTGN